MQTKNSKGFRLLALMLVCVMMMLAMPFEAKAEENSEVRAETASEVEAETASEVEAETALEVEAETTSEVKTEVKFEDAEYIKYLEAKKQPVHFTDFKTASFGVSSVGSHTVRAGIDVSEFQGVIDWNRVKRAGVEFVFVRVGVRSYGLADGKIYVDNRAIENLRGAKAAGLDVGAYIFSQALTEQEAIEEANFAINMVRQSGVTLDLPLTIDYEYDPYLVGRLYTAHLSAGAGTRACRAFMQLVKAAGYEPMVYANKSMLENSLYAYQLEREGKIWLAEWRDTPYYGGSYSYWQYSETGRIDGISGNVDLDLEMVPPVAAGENSGITAPSYGNPGSTEPEELPDNTDKIDGVYITYVPMKTATAVVLNDFVNVRKGPSTTFASLGQLVKNNTFKVTGTYKDVWGTLWYRATVTLGGKSSMAYICSDYACLKSDLPAAPSLKQTTQTMSSIKVTWTKVSGATKYKVYRYNYTTGKYVSIATVDGSLNYYKDTGLISYKKQKYIVKAIKYKNNLAMYSAASNSRIGYTGGMKGYVNRAQGLAVHSGPGTKDKLCTLKNNERVNIVATSGNSYKVFYDHEKVTKVGYVNKKYIRLG